jgi:hypothetical protein
MRSVIYVEIKSTPISVPFPLLLNGFNLMAVPRGKFNFLLGSWREDCYSCPLTAATLYLKFMGRGGGVESLAEMV